jgi:hypothetical protein
MRRAMPDSQHYVILKHNFQTGQSEDISEAARGRGRADAAVERLRQTLTSAERDGGWDFMLKPASRASAVPYMPSRVRRKSSTKRRSYTGR